KIDHFKISVAINGRLGEYKIVGGEAAVAVVEEDIKALLLLGEEHCDIWPAIAVEILDDAANGARAWQQDMLAVLLTAQIFKPGKAPCVVAVLAQDEVNLAVAIEIRKLGMSGTRQIGQKQLRRAETRPSLIEKRERAPRII